MGNQRVAEKEADVKVVSELRQLKDEYHQIKVVSNLDELKDKYFQTNIW